ncbi:MAG: glycosyltransferase family 87 protein [Candidatus Eisenbacteria bacterium]
MPDENRKGSASHASERAIRRHRFAALAIGSIGLLVIVLAAVRGVGPIFDAFDNLPGLLVDFQTIYLAQAHLLVDAPGTIHPKWLYPPLLAILFRGFTVTGPAAAFWIWLGVQIGAVLLLALLCQRQLRAMGGSAAWMAAVGLVVLSLPVVHCVKWGQVSLLIAAGSIVALRRPGAGTGVLMGLLCGMKVYPAGYLINALPRRRWRFLLWVLISAVVLGIAIPVLAIGWTPTTMFCRKIYALTRAMTLASKVPGAQGISGLIDSWFFTRAHFGLPPGGGPWLVELSRGLRSVTAIIFSLALLAGMLWRTRRLRLSHPVAVAMVLVTVTLILRPAWHHYFCFLPFALAAVWARALRDPPALAMAAFSWIVAALPVVSLPLAPEFFHWYSALGGTTVAALSAWGALWIVAGREEDGPSP